MRVQYSARAQGRRYAVSSKRTVRFGCTLARYFRQHGATWALSADVLGMVEFRELNLTKPWPALPRTDLVFLRNVMIYFDVETKKSILGRVARLLRPDGYLLLGGAESALNLDASFLRVEHL